MDISSLEGCQLTDAHFHLDKVCRALGKPLSVDAFNGIKDTPGAPPESSSIVLGIAVICFMLHQVSNLKVSSSELQTHYEGIMRNPALAGLHLKRATKCLEAADTIVTHLQMPCIVAAGELGIDHHRNKDSMSQTNSSEFLLLVLKWIRAQPTLKDLPLVLHVHEARLHSIAASASSPWITLVCKLTTSSISIFFVAGRAT